MSKTAFLFPGQGVQKAGMGKDFYEHSAVAREIFDMASEVLQMDMKKLCFTENEKLNQTEYTQAALVTTCLAMVEERGSQRNESGCDSRIESGRILCDRRFRRHV